MTTLHEVLMRVKAARPDPRAGICDNARHVAEARCTEERAFELGCALEKLMRDWPDAYTGAPDEGWFATTRFPVGGRAAYWEEVRRGALWSNPRRRELLDWLIAQAAARGL